MTEPFNRIIRDFNKFGGQPFIDGTNITVNQILSKSIQGWSIENILSDYPELSAEDIHQALGFVVSDIFKGVSYWRHDGMTPLTQIKGYSEILVGKTDFDDLDTIPDEQKHQWLSIIHTSSQRGIARWQQMGQWMSNQYFAQTDNDTEVYSLERFIIDIVNNAQNYEPSLDLDVTQINTKINIETHSDTALILSSILAFAKNTFKPETYIELTSVDSYVIVNIHRQLLYADDDIQKLFTTPYSPVSTALTFFHTQQIAFSINITDDTVTFTIEIPIWEEQ